MVVEFAVGKGGCRVFQAQGGEKPIGVVMLINKQIAGSAGPHAGKLAGGKKTDCVIRFALAGKLSEHLELHPLDARYRWIGTGKPNEVCNVKKSRHCRTGTTAIPTCEGNPTSPLW